MSWKSLIGSIAPTIATALGGPLAGMATKALTSELFPGEEVPEKELDARIDELVATDPEALARIKQIDADFKTKMKKLDIDLEGIHAGDRASARDMAEKTSLRPQIVLATVYNLGFILIIYAVFFSALNLVGVQKDIALYLLGILSAGLVQINNFFFGSSSGSKSKTAALAAKPKG